MTCHTLPEVETGARKLIFVGCPNVGKSLLFNYFTGRYATVSNYPGTTVEVTRATVDIDGIEREVIDTPGTNSLVPQSEDERVTRDILLASPEADTLQVGDMKNLRRTLFMTLQLAEYGRPFSLCLNMSDEARDSGVTVDSDRLSTLLGVNVVPTSALRRWNLERLKKASLAPRLSPHVIAYSPPVEHGILRIVDLLPELPVARRAVAVSILSGDDSLKPYLQRYVSASVFAKFDRIREEVEASVSEPLSYVISRDRLAAVDQIVDEVFVSDKTGTSNTREWLGSIMMHRFWGVPILAAVLLIGYWFVGKFGAGTLVDLVENTIFNHFINPYVIKFFDLVAPFPHTHTIDHGVLVSDYALRGNVTGIHVVARFAHDLFVGPYGIVTMALTYAIAIVLPVVTTFFIFFGILEDSGYLPRLAVMLNRFFKWMGLNGKAVLPMVLGLGCDTMATLTTRILETKKEAMIVTILLALGVPCSAQLGVIVAMLGPLTPVAVFIWLGVIVGTIFLVGWLSSKILPGEAGDFLLEIPPVRMPKMTNILVKVMARTEWYLKEAVPLFLVGTLILYVAELTGALRYVQHAVSPLVVGLLQLPPEAANAFILGFLRRDYGAAGLFVMQRNGHLDPIQTIVSLTVITLFIPCIANFFMMIKERGLKAGLWVSAFIITYSFGIGWALNTVLRSVHLNLG